MENGQSIQDFEYTIHDAKGIRGVKDGKEYPITEEEYRRKNPYHRDVRCTECNFVQDKETLLLWVISREAKEKATTEPSFIGKFTMPDWTGHSAFYLFRCEYCDSVIVDYPHGYSNGGCIYLRCDLCREKLVPHPIKDRDIYLRDNVHIPVQPSRKEKKDMLKLLKARQKEVEIVEDMGIRVIVPGQEILVAKSSKINFWNVGLVLLVLLTLGIALLTHPNWHPF